LGLWSISLWRDPPQLVAIIENEGDIVVMQAARATLHFFISDFATLFQGGGATSTHTLR